ncbi:Retrovirus-related Pol polyprotein from transposon, partial [Dictyocoela muelleri]
MEEKFILVTDASQNGIGAVLKQTGKSIAYISSVSKGAEINYSISEREMLAALWAMEKFEYYLIGRKLKIITDHKALEVIQRKKDFGSLIMQRWLERLSRFDFEVLYREGSKLIQADALSRTVSVNTDTNLLTNMHGDNEILKLHEK